MRLLLQFYLYFESPIQIALKKMRGRKWEKKRDGGMTKMSSAPRHRQCVEEEKEIEKKVKIKIKKNGVDWCVGVGLQGKEKNKKIKEMGSESSVVLGERRKKNEQKESRPHPKKMEEPNKEEEVGSLKKKKSNKKRKKMEGK